MKVQFDMDIKDLYEVKHSLQAALRYKKNTLVTTDKDESYKFMLVQDIIRAESLLTKVMNNIEKLKEC